MQVASSSESFEVHTIEQAIEEWPDYKRELEVRRRVTPDSFSSVAAHAEDNNVACC